MDSYVTFKDFESLTNSTNNSRERIKAFTKFSNALINFSKENKKMNIKAFKKFTIIQMEELFLDLGKFVGIKKF